MNKMVLQLATMPACSAGLIGFRKEVLKVGHYVKESTNQAFDITVEFLDSLVATFDRWIAGGNKCPVPLGHERVHLPEFNRGWVKSLFREDNSLYGILELSDPELALTTDVSVCVEGEVTDGKGIKYENVLTHIALTCEPVVGQLQNFMKLSLSNGETNMEFLTKLATKLGIKNAEEEAILLALETKTKDKVEASNSVETKIDPLVKLVSENRAMKLSNLVKAGLITPAVKDVIAARYVEPKVLALSMQDKADDGFDLLQDILVQNRRVDLDETTGVQSLELSNPAAAQPNAIQKDIARRRELVGLKD